MAQLLSVADALATLVRAVLVLPAETLPLVEANGRCTATAMQAKVTQPPFAASAMDGYAVRLADLQPNARLRVVGESPAGRPCTTAVGTGEAVRIFTGGAMPPGADHVLIQENARRQGELVQVTLSQAELPNNPEHVRAAGIDFHQGDSLVPAGTRLSPIHLALLAAANWAEVPVIRRPRVVLFTAGDELRDPGSTLAPGQVVNSNRFALAALIRAWGGSAEYLGCAADDPQAIATLYQQASSADLVVPVGGASVGDHDHMRRAFADLGGSLVFSKVALRPGKPTWFGQLPNADTATSTTPVLGLPGNPTSALVTATLFLQPLVQRLCGRLPAGLPANGWLDLQPATLAAPLSANGPRETWWRGHRTIDANGCAQVQVLTRQDSSLLSTLAAANVLVRVAAGAPAQAAGSLVSVLPLG